MNGRPSEAAARTIAPRRPVDLGLTLSALRRGGTDPTMRISRAEVWRATRTPEGPVTTRITGTPRALTMRAWGPGAAWALGAFPALVGADDLGDVDDVAMGHPVVHDLGRRLRGLRICRSGAVVEAVVPSIIEQKVIGSEARRSYAALLRAVGEPAPVAAGRPPGLLVPPDPRALARTPTWVFHRCGIERKRADAIRLACSYAHRLDEVATLPLAEAYHRLTVLPGMGPWTAAEVALVALGDADAVSVGDFHLPHQVAFALAGEPRADDARMLELLEPYRGQRGRVIRLITLGAPKPPRFGPRLAYQRIASF